MNYIKPLLPFLACWALLLSSETTAEVALWNGFAQLILFVFVVLIPTWRTGRMSYVDIGWPMGLAIIGLATLSLGQGDTTRVGAISLVFLFIGLRMGLGAIKMWRGGHLDTELPRYEYQRLRWQKKGIKNFPLIMQSEALSQGAANMSFLALPAFIIASNASSRIHWLELLGLALWIIAFFIESLADAQKNTFLREVRAKGLSKQVCNVGLWRYSRHPNYFGEWLVWNALIIASIPSWLALQDKEPFITWILLGIATLFISRIMYTTLVTYTGAKPAEFYSAQKRPGYREYQQQTNMFFPGPPRL